MAPLAHLRILLAQCDGRLTESLRLAAAGLAAGQVTVEHAGYLADARSLVAGVRFDLLILDLAIDTRDAVEAFVAETAGAMPVIVLAGAEELELAERALDLGAEDCLSRGAPSAAALLLQARRAIARHRDAREAERARERYTELTGRLNVGVWRVVPEGEGRLIEANLAMGRIFEAGNPDELMRHPIGGLFQKPADRDRLFRLLLDSGEIEAEPVEMRTLRGRTFMASFTARAARDGDGGLCFDGFTEDITERQRIERRLEARDRAALLGNSLANIAHTMKNLDLTLSGSVALLRRSTRARDWPTHREAVELIGRCTERLHLLMMNLLDESRPHAKAAKAVNLTSFRLEDLLGQLQRYLKEEAHARGVRFEVDLPADLPAVCADRDRVFQMLENLAINAMDAMPHGGRLGITAALRPGHVAAELSGSLARREALLELAICDTGEGIDPEAIGRIFEPFYSTKGSRGTGLGLHMVADCMREHDGAIAVDSAPGEGTCFRLYFPLPEPAGAPKLRHGARAERDGAPWRGARPQSPKGPPAVESSSRTVRS